MRRDDIIRMAREAGLAHSKPRTGDYDGGRVAGSIADLIRFVGLVAVAEREACAKVCDGIRYKGYCPPEDGAAPDYYNEAAEECAEAIRNWGE